MHETAVVEGLMRILTEQAKANKVGRVIAVKLRIGKLRGIDSRQIRLAFEIFAEGTLAEGARLDIEDVGVTARCNVCDTVFEVAQYRFVCSGCGGSDAEVLTGRELYIESFEAAPL